MVITIRLAYGTDEKRQTILLHRGLPVSALSNRMLDKIVHRKRGSARSTKKKTTRKGKSVGKEAEKSDDASTHKITEYFPLRRSSRKTEKQLEQEERDAMANAILTGSNEEFLEIFECEEKGRGIRTLRNFQKNEFVVEYKDETPYKGRLINHSVIRPNLKTKVIELNGSKHLILIAKRDIDIGEELLYDYGDRTPCTVAENPWLLNS
ncbi:set domain-containing protein 1 [Wuchereria bancrofti]|uniref:Set domain-containing protein 1 n=1 Tax=Wuchereria bancrofti TaxID=6293 RepID=J9BBS3_WUCBA|nr:set domain-containing protein 1 [Wuchereria bancrofti]